MTVIDGCRFLLLLILLGVLSVHGFPQLSRHIIVAVLVVTTVSTLLGAGFGPAFMASLSELVHSEEIPRVTGWVQSLSAAAQIIGLLGGGMLYSAVRVQGMVLLDAAAYSVSLVGLRVVAHYRSEAGSHDPPDKSAPHQWTRELYAGLQWLRGAGRIMQLLILVFVLNMGLAPIELAQTVWLHDLGVGALWLGIVSTCYFAGMLVVGMLVSRILAALRPDRVLGGSVICAGCAVAAIGISRTLALDLASMSLFGLSIGLFEAVIAADLSTTVPENMRGRIFSVAGFVSTASMPIGMFMFGLLSAWSIQSWFIASGAFVGLAGVGYVRLLRKKSETSSTSADSM